MDFPLQSPVPISLFLFHFLANKPGVPRFRIDHGVQGQTTAGHRVGIFLLDYYAVFDEFGGGWWQLAPYGRRARRNRLLLRRATGQKQAKYQPSFPHALVFALSSPLCRWQSWLHAATWTQYAVVNRGTGTNWRDGPFRSSRMADALAPCLPMA